MGRSKLKSESPIAFGTPLVESVDSYMERLAATHDTMRRSLERVVLGRGIVLASRHHYHDQFLADAPTDRSHEFCGSLAHLTQQPSVARLGLSWMRSVIPEMEALKPFKAWCAECCRDSYQGRRENYWPLLWSIASVDACTVHQTKLDERCRNCGSCISGKRGPLYPFHSCPHCQGLLHEGRASSRAGMRSRASNEELTVAELVGNMLADIGSATKDATLEPLNLRTVVQSATQRGLVRGMNEFLVQAKLSRSTYSCLINGGRVSLRTAIRIAIAADINLIGLYCPSLWKESKSQCRTLSVPDPRPRKVINADRLTKAAQAEIRSGTACSVHEFCKKMKVDRKDVRRLLGPLTNVLAAAALKAKQERRHNEATHMAKAITRELGSMRASGVRPSGRKLARAVGCTRHRLDFVSGLQIAMPERVVRYARVLNRRK